MMLVDSSVWIAQLRGQRTASTAKLEAAVGREVLLVGDLILLEVLQGARNEAHAARIERGLRRFGLVSLLDADLAVCAARKYRKLRELALLHFLWVVTAWNYSSGRPDVRILSLRYSSSRRP